MTVHPAPPAPRPTLVSQLPILAATLLIGIAGGWSLAALVYPGKGAVRPLIQRGHVRFDASDGLEFDVRYAFPFAGQPTLTFDTPAAQVQEQRPDGFKVRVDTQAQPSQLSWTAEGAPAR
jgi:hypothetical protein